LSGVPNGLQIYNTDNHCVETRFPTGWRPVMCDCSSAPATPAAIISNPGYCPGDANVLFTVTPSAGATTYQWVVDGLDTIVSGQGSDSLILNLGSATGARNISVSAVNFCGTSSSVSSSYSVDSPSAAFSSLPVSPIVNNAATFTATQGGLSSYSWVFSGANPPAATGSSAQATWTSLGTYSVSLSVTDANGCSDSQSVQVVVTNCQPTVVNFSTCGQQGNLGPSQTQCNSAYGAGVVTVTGGIQFWTVPVTGTYEIEVGGADGSHNGSGWGGGGRGAVMRARFSLTQGDVLKILVGQQGKHGVEAGAGGGGTFVTRSDNTPLLIAGGGGSSRSGATLNLSVMDATTHTCGRNGTAAAGGCNGNGAAFTTQQGPGGAGLLGNGPTHGDTRSMCIKTIAFAFVNGGAGGEFFILALTATITL
jgi:hypothetical protein